MYESVGQIYTVFSVQIYRVTLISDDIISHQLFVSY